MTCVQFFTACAMHVLFTKSSFSDDLKVPERAESRPFRAVINDIFKTTSNSLTISARVEAGSLENGEKVFIMPNADPCVAKGRILRYCGFK